jgi:anti-anti-sigma factor
MLLDLAPGWTMELDRGPDWLFVRIHGPADGDTEGANFAERIWELLDREFAHRLVVELDTLTMLRSCFVGELVRLHKRVTAHGGIMRVCGLSDRCQDVLRASRLSDRFPNYGCREEAVMAAAPNKPR